MKKRQLSHKPLSNTCKKCMTLVFNFTLTYQCHEKHLKQINVHSRSLTAVGGCMLDK